MLKTAHQTGLPIADFALGDLAKVPETALRRAATLLLDTIGVAAGAAHLDASRLARDFAADFLAAGATAHSAPIMFDGRRASLAGAAYAAATQIDNLDGHDGYNPTKGHIGCAVVPALFAFSELRADLTGREALRSMVMAYEVAARAGLALHATVSDYHTSGAWNALGVAALGCRLMKASPEQLRHALGIAEYHGPRSQMMREIANPSMLHDGSGMGAFTGVSAALLAMRGFEGAPAITLEADAAGGYWRDLGAVWTIERNYIKPYPICRWAHAAIDATRQLQSTHGFGAGDIAHVLVNTFDEAAELFMGVPATTSQAQYSLAFAVATVLCHGHIGPQHVAGDGLRDASVAQLVPLIEAVPQPRHSERFPEGRWSDVVITLKSGDVVASGDVNASGGPEAPLDDRQVRQKFELMAGNSLDARRAEEIRAAGYDLLQENVPFSRLARLVDTTGA